MSFQSRAPRFLTADIGNSAVKLVLWSGGAADEARVEARLRVPLGELARVAAWLDELTAPEGVAVSCVARPEVRAALAAALEGHFALPAQAPPTPRLTLECRAPAQVGEDRVFAAHGALALVGAPAIVVDAGTALTVDVLVAGERAGFARFLGGAIAPGPDLLARSLSSETARLPRVEPALDAPALGRDTESAIRAGVGVGFAGAAGHLALELAREAGLLDPPIVLTGGARDFLLAAFAPRRPRVVPDLVHVGLLTAGSAACGVAWRVGQDG